MKGEKMVNQVYEENVYNGGVSMGIKIENRGLLLVLGVERDFRRSAKKALKKKIDSTIELLDEMRAGIT